MPIHPDALTVLMIWDDTKAVSGRPTGCTNFKAKFSSTGDHGRIVGAAT
jgi:hypothetical protein